MAAKSYLLGLDVGSSSVKASLVEVDTGRIASSALSPKEEMTISSPQPGWAEQDPEDWWKHACAAVGLAIRELKPGRREVRAIGISYQMHGLVLLDKDHRVLRPSIIWCDSRAVSFGEKAFKTLGEEYCLRHLLNSPGNFTAAKLAWVKDNEPQVYSKIRYAMLPGDYFAYRLTGNVSTTDTGLSEGVFWDFVEGKMSDKLLAYFGFDSALFPARYPLFSVPGNLSAEAAGQLGLPAGIPLGYRAGDQPNNAFSLNALRPGETAATAGTSGVIYSVTDSNAHDPQSRVNTFLHVNHTKKNPRNGVLLCVNGAGLLNSWLKRHVSAGLSYDDMNERASRVPAGSDGLMFFPFGNGAERILSNRSLGASLHGMDLNRHGQHQVLRAAQEGIVFALRYGFDILKEMGVPISVIRAGHANMFLSPLFREVFVNTVGRPLELYETNGAVGAALGAGLGTGIYSNETEALSHLKRLERIEPSGISKLYETFYQQWKERLMKMIAQEP